MKTCSASEIASLELDNHIPRELSGFAQEYIPPFGLALQWL
jgi:hypothetical protein